MPKKSHELVLHTMGQNRIQGFAIPLQLRRDNHVQTGNPLTLSDDVSGLSSEHKSGGQILKECRKK